MDNFDANLKEVNDLIDAHEYDKERDLAFRICWNCKHYDAWHAPEGCAYYSDGRVCDCEGFDNAK